MNAQQFEKRNQKKINLMKHDSMLTKTSLKWITDSYQYEYSYHFKWLGLPIIQYPQDIVALQEIIWKIKPDLIVETGVARGGSLIFFASILEMIGSGEVVGIDIEIRKQNRKALENHTLFKRIHLIEGSSVNKKIIDKVSKFTRGKKTVMVILDSNHEHDHVLKELNAYSHIVTKGSYLVVFDTIVADLQEKLFKNRPWGKNNNPKSAVTEFLKNSNRFKIDNTITNKLLISAAPSGYLKCVRK